MIFVDIQEEFEGKVSVITSYSIHYTKLYELIAIDDVISRVREFGTRLVEITARVRSPRARSRLPAAVATRRSKPR